MTRMEDVCASKIMNRRIPVGLLALQLILNLESTYAQDRTRNSTTDGGSTVGAYRAIETNDAAPNTRYSTTQTSEPQYAGYDRVPAYVASPYPVYHRDYYRQTRYNPAYAIPPSNLPLFPERKPDWNPSRSLWYSARPAPWYFGHWYYPRYVRSTNGMPTESVMSSNAACPPGSGPIRAMETIDAMPTMP